eukprot:GILJ01005222.1.p1 GENE.GILJ01005222.1~~GILJ01005222.1.p1  ORF type:complete len:290 (+),score=38.22 GILJ01005222.1:81-872(+)
MAVILPANDAIYQIAQCFLLLSYVQVNILFLRVVLCFGSLFFAIWCGVSLPGISVDGVVYNVIFGFINFVQAIFLAREMLPIKFTPEQQQMYKTLFGSFLTPYQFKLLLNHGRRRKIRKLNSVLSQEGNPFSMIALVVEKDPTAVFIVEKDGVKLNELSLYNWIGMPEYTEYLEAKKLAEGKSVDGDILNRVTHKLMTDDAPVAFWVWEVEVFSRQTNWPVFSPSRFSKVCVCLSLTMLSLMGVLDSKRSCVKDSFSPTNMVS